MRIVLVAGTGPVGRAATPHLLAAGHDLAVLTRARTSPRTHTAATICIELPLDPLPLDEDAARRTSPSPSAARATTTWLWRTRSMAPPAFTVLRPDAIYGPYLRPG